MLLALELADRGGRVLDEVELRELFAQGIETIHGGRVVLIVMTADRLGRQTVDLLGIEAERLYPELGRRGGGYLLGAGGQCHGADQQAGARGQGAAGDIGHRGLLKRPIRTLTLLRKESCGALPVRGSAPRSA